MNKRLAHSIRPLLTRAFVAQALIFILAFLLLTGKALQLNKDFTLRLTKERYSRQLKDIVDIAYDTITADAASVEKETRLYLRDKVSLAGQVVAGLRLSIADNVPEMAQQGLVLDALKAMGFDQGRGAFFALRPDGEILIDFAGGKEQGPGQGTFAHDREVMVADMIDLVTREVEGGLVYPWQGVDQLSGLRKKMIYIKYIRDVDLIVGACYCLDDMKAVIQERALERIGAIQYGEDGYLFVLDFDGVYLSHHEKRYIGQNLLHLKDSSGFAVNKELIDLGKQGGGFLEYLWDKYSTGEKVPKLSYVRAVADWQWVIGTGVYLDDLEKEQVAMVESLQKQVTFAAVGLVLVVLAALGLFLFFLNRLTGRLVS